MNVTSGKDRTLLIVPETEFEREYLEVNFNEPHVEYDVYLKTGLTPADVVGLKIVRRAERGSASDVT